VRGADRARPPKRRSEDREVTKRLIDAGKLLGIRLLDHVVVSAEGYFAMREHHADRFDVR
jgi:DNA repair protein RadC